ncbi:hypothetical protein V0R51_23755 [Pseudomonas otitidis]|uniref:hypothetical protein n=1 Tax=Metapseudomonas otitidis TaxID=319939 RepID=UPI002E7B7C12|nr:hypothetical protein [Pseudomonas otitidis]MEE1895928.1 hypothetical protein [Pseudomonas otitidis]
MEDQYKAEQERIDWRRETLGIDTPSEPRRRPWALALSGGGIRSATFCFGVLQALARAPYTQANRPLGSTGDAHTERLLPRFDYLSTVSGGGYMGSFFSSLFQPGRLRPSTGTEQAQARQAAEDAYRVLSYQPPGRIHSSTDYNKAEIGAGPTAWLRENGRYLTPTGAGDLLYALAMTWRNWAAVHLVIGLPILLVTALLALTQGLACSRWNLFCDHLLAIPLGIALVAVAPLMLAYWLIYSRKTLDDKPMPFNWATGSALLMAVTLGWLTCQMPDTPDGLPTPARDLLWVVVTVLGLGLAWCAALAASQYRRPNEKDNDDGLDANNVRNYRLRVTRALSKAITWAAVALVLVLVHQLTFELYTVLARHWQGSLTFSVLPVLIWLVRHLARSRDEKPAPGLLKKLPLDALALVAGLALLLAVTLAWGLLAHWFAWNGRVPGAHAGDAQLFRFGLLAVIALVMAVVTGQFIGFINLSSLQAFYAARLTRAYLGASNGQRFDVSCAQSRRRMSVAQTLSRDDIPLKDYYGKRTAGPLHLINVTMNLTVDPAEQLVQRDRKGKPLCVAPYRYTPGGEQDQVTSFILDGQRKSRQPPNGRGEINQPLSLGQWVATSGAAASTGLGRQTSLGLSLLLGLANVRLGTWWQSNFVGRAKPLSRIGEASSHWLPTQTYLFYELTARFHGHRRDKLYLTDGGHFENTATYELLRPARDIELVVICDCGCDPEYRFDDLANLVRLSRIDHDLEIEEDPGVLRHPLLSQVFGSTQSLRAATEPSDRRCAVLLNVFHTPDRENPDIPRRLTSRILLIKPRLIEGVPTDVLNYVRANPDFPNQTTGDQFFDEAQFESYRQLGLSIGQLLFGDGQRPNNIAHALSRYLAKPVLEDAAGE